MSEYTITVQDEYITLGQLLKIADIISSGGEAKVYLNSHTVLLNGEEENRRGKKCYKGDTLIIEGKTYVIA